MIKRRPLFWLTVFFAAGIITGYYVHFVYIICGGVITGFILFLYNILISDFRFSNRFKKITVFAILFLMAGVYWIHIQKNKYDSPLSIVYWNNQGNVTITGEIVEDLRSLEGEKLYLKSYRVEKNQKQYLVKYGLIELSKEYLPLKLDHGDLVKIELSLKEPARQLNPGGFSYFKFLKRKGIYSQGYIGNKVVKLGHINHFVKESIISIKKNLLYLIDSSMQSSERDIVKAVLLGERENVPQDWQEKFTNAGANHLLAISGLHVSFIMLILLTVFNICRLPDLVKNVLISLFMVFYIILTGGRASVFRAGLLTAFFLWAPYVKRQGDLFNILGLTAFINLVINPYVLFDIGFQLTYTVIIMIVLWVDVFKNLSLKIIAVSLAAQLGSAPITAYYFNQLTPVGLITNIWAIPLMAVVVFVEFIGLTLGLLHPVFALITAKITGILLYLLNIGISVMINIPFSYIEIASPAPWHLVIIYVYLIIIPIVIKPRYIFSNIKKQNKTIVVLVMAAVLLICANQAKTFFENELEVIFFAVGQGDSIFIKSPSGKYFLVDGGGQAGRDSDQGQQVILPYLRKKGIKKLDAVFITHFDNDHALGIISVLRQKQVNMLVIPANFARNKLSQEIISIALKKDIPVKLAVKGNKFQTGQLLLKILNPDKITYTNKNNNSIVIKVILKNFSILLTGDLEGSGEYRLINSNKLLQSDILKLGHHGSNTSSERYFLKKVIPEEGIISVGKNYYGHPSPAILQRLHDLGINIWRTDKQGAIIIKSRGYKYNIQGFKKQNYNKINLK